MQRWSHKKLIAACVGPLWEWVHAGDLRLRLYCFRSLGGVPEGTTLPSEDDKAESVDSLVSECRVLIVKFLLNYAQGTSSEIYQEYWKDEIQKRCEKTGTPPKKYRPVYPYGPNVAETNEGFTQLPTSNIANTLSCVYTFLAVEKRLWENLYQEYSHPMTALWPEGVLRRIIHFVMICRTDWPDVLRSYEDAGGDYYGDESDDEESSSEENEDEDNGEDEEEDEDKQALTQVDDVF